jgi:hypothetical protein
MIAFERFHTYAIGLGPRAVPPGSKIEQQAKLAGFATPDPFTQARFTALGWNPVIFYPAKSSPVQGPDRAEWIVVAYRAGSTISEAEALASHAFEDVRWWRDAAQ